MNKHSFQNLSTKLLDNSKMFISLYWFWARPSEKRLVEVKITKA